jgi:hypothetical protein
MNKPMGYHQPHFKIEYNALADLPAPSNMIAQSV